jgi:predicted CxxxxCH...CXXCH cytochrome family protein
MLLLPPRPPPQTQAAVPHACSSISCRSTGTAAAAAAVSAALAQAWGEGHL